jgi:outer membrane lipoprotein-sorting protein
VKARRLIALIVVLFLFSCLPKKTEIPGTEVPAGPLVQALEEQRQSFTWLRAIASVEVVKRGGKRVFDTVGIVLDAQRRFRVEAVGPVGQSLMAIVWDGNNVLLRMQDDDRIVRPGQAGIEKLLGMSVNAKDLCAIFSGTTTEITRPLDARVFCTKNSACVVELPEAETVRRIHVLPPSSSPVAVRIAAQELYRSNTLVYRVRYERMQEVSHVLLPRIIVIENPEKGVTITIEYAEVDVNMPVADDAFTLSDQGAVGSGK